MVFERATKRYRTLTALDSFELSIEPGTLFSLVGPNGAGKTTAIGLLTGLIHPTSGAARVFGFDVAREPLAAKACIGFVPDRPYLWPKWTPRETLRFVGTVFGARGAALEKRIDNELSAFGLLDSGNLRNEVLSHGTRQKVALAQAFLHEPSLYILDEPMVGLDPLAQLQLIRRLQEKASAGAAVFLTTHQLALAEQVSHRAALLIKGRLAAVGTPAAMRGGGLQGSLSELFFRLTDGSALEAPLD
ncbi:MAG: ABC transporter ATP-binding protein [Thermoanaerobaculia bacterium]